MGNIDIDGELIGEKEAVLFGPGKEISIRALDEQVEVVYFESRELGEKIAWAGPIVMNTKRELIEAYDELDRGEFLKSKIRMNEE